LRFDLTVIPAGPADAETIDRLLYEAAAWLESRGIRQWSAVWPPSERHQAVTRERIARGWCYLSRCGAAIAGTLTLQPSDRALWGEDGDRALYVHGLAISRGFAGQGVGLAPLRWAEREAAARGRRWLRLDCKADNYGLRAYYRRAGFSEVREIDQGQGWKAVLFEKSVLKE
jgi:ribosomal protein S18 acetylase RimI-like enzyme